MKLGKQFWVDKLGERWTLELEDMLKTPYTKKLMNFLNTEYALNHIEPSKRDVFNAFKYCPWDSLKVVILGHRPSDNSTSNGLAYGDKYTSLFHSGDIIKIFECIEKEYYNGLYLDFDFSLEEWAKQGVLLLNRSITTRVDSDSHKKPWGTFVSATINAINEKKPGTIFVFWGKEFQQIIPHINKNNYILKYDHPSLYIGSNKAWSCPNFKEVNQLLIKQNKQIIKW